MRIMMKLNSPFPQLLEYNYNHYLNGFLYNMIGKSNIEISTKLHNEGYLAKGKTIKPLVFSRLYFDNRKATKRGLIVEGEGRWFVSSLYEELLLPFISSTAQQYKLVVGDVSFLIDEVQIMRKPKFTDDMDFTMLSPTVAPKRIPEQNNRLKFCHPMENEFYDILKENILRKYKLIYKTDYSGDRPLNFSVTYPEKMDIKKAACLVRYRSQNIKCYMFPITLTGDPKLIELCYELGIGSYNIQGFGMLELVERR